MELQDEVTQRAVVVLVLCNHIDQRHLVHDTVINNGNPGCSRHALPLLLPVLLVPEHIPIVHLDLRGVFGMLSAGLVTLFINFLHTQSMGKRLRLLLTVHDCPGS